MVRNPDFEQEMQDWTVEQGGTATNNGYPEKRQAFLS